MPLRGDRLKLTTRFGKPLARSGPPCGTAPTDAAAR